MMNDHELDLALSAMGQRRTAVVDLPELHELVRSTAATAPQHRRFLPLFTGRFQSMFSATKFVVAGAIVALLGGFLLTGVLTQPHDESSPVVGASASTSAQPTLEATAKPEPSMDPEAEEQADTTTRSDILSGVDLATEEVEPGVLRIVNDSVRDLSWTHVGDNLYSILGGEIVAGLDGSIWNATAESPRVIYRLGDTDSHETTQGLERIAIDPDGHLWAFVYPDRGPVTLQSFDGTEWKVRRTIPKKTFGWDALEVGADGAVWASWLVNGGKQPNGYAIGRRTPETGRWKIGQQGSKTLPDGEPNDEDLHVTTSLGGDAVFVASDRRFARLGGVGDDRYEVGAVVDPPVHRIYFGAWARRGIAATDDGTVWIDGTRRDGTRVIARTTDLDDQEAWEVFDVAEFPTTGLPEEASFAPILAGVSADGSAWLHGQFDRGDCDGIHRFDGSTWTTFLAGSCPLSVDFAADGAVWLQAGSSGTVNTYVITPEAVAATE